MRPVRVALVIAAAGLPWPASAQEAPRLRGPQPFTREVPAPPMQREVTNDIRVRRNYPDQPPLIPHSVDGYEISLSGNKCLSCHARKFTEQSQAPMISVTHYQDRNGNTLGGLAPRRYHCTACHVVQVGVRPLVENQFTDMDALTANEPQGALDHPR